MASSFTLTDFFSGERERKRQWEGVRRWLAHATAREEQGEGARGNAQQTQEASECTGKMRVRWPASIRSHWKISRRFRLSEAPHCASEISVSLDKMRGVGKVLGEGRIWGGGVVVVVVVGREEGKKETTSDGQRAKEERLSAGRGRKKGAGGGVALECLLENAASAIWTA
jgi:hypothetical protein